MQKWLGRLAKGIAALVIAVCVLMVFVPPFLDRQYHRGPASDHYDGERFFNPDGEDTILPVGGRSRFGFFARWVTRAGERAEWPQTVSVTPARPAQRVAGDRMVVTWVGHATVLIQTQGINILTDPIWADRSGPFNLGPKRVAEPGIRFEDLPPIDLVLLSHNHYDHLHKGSLRRLVERDKALIVTGLGNDALLASSGIPAVALDWGGARQVRPGITVHAVRNHHWSTRTLSDRNRALWSAFVVKLPGGNVMFAGDTGFGDGKWPGEAARLGPVRLALIPIGAFRFEPGQMHTGSHIGPVQAVEVFRTSGAAQAIPIHWGTFQLSDEAIDTPPRMLAEAMKCSALPVERFAPTRIGQMVEIPAFSAQPAGRQPDQACLEGPAIQTLR